MDVVKQLKFGLSFLVSALVGGTLGYSLIEGWRPLDSLYMTVITITTVGYGEVRPLSRAGTVFTMILILSSVGMVAFMALLRPAVVDFMEIAMHRRSLELQLEEIRVHTVDQLSSPTLRESGIRSDLDLVIVAVKKESGKMIYNPSSETQIEAGDILIAMGERKNLEKLVGFEARPENLT